MNTNNFAYDLSIYETAYETNQSKNKTKTRANSKKVIKAQAKFGLGKKIYNVISVAILLSLVIGIIATNASIASHTSQINTKLNAITSLENDQNYLEITLEGRANLTQVDEYATSVLGLSKRDNSQVLYIELEEENTIEIKDESLRDKINQAIKPVMSYLLP